MSEENKNEKELFLDVNDEQEVSEDEQWHLSDDLEVVDGSPEESKTEEVVVSFSNADIEDEEIRKNMLAVLEGLLFLVGDDGLTVEQASDTLGTKDEVTVQLFDALQKEYLDDARGIEIACFGKTYKFLSKANVHPYAQRLFQISSHEKLSNAALETLAIIAYKQPVTRVEIEEIRGVGVDMMLRKLEARGLIKEDGRSEAPGKPILYSVTDEFMDAFQLLSLEELPELPQFNDESGEESNTNLFES